MVLLTDRAECTFDSQLRVTTVNQYRILDREAGSGTYCVVQWAESKDKELFAVKVFSRHALEHTQVAFFDETGAATESLQEKVRRELEILAALRHPNLVQLVEVIDDPKQNAMFSVFEALHGGQLLHWKRKHAAYHVTFDADTVQKFWGSQVASAAISTGEKEIVVFQEAAIRHFFKSVLQGCAYLHEQGVIHKDVKPDNVLLTAPVPQSDPRFVNRLSLQDWPTSAPRKPLMENNSPTSDGDAGQLLQSHQVSAKLADFNCARIGAQSDCLIWDAEGTQLFTPPECFAGASEGVKGKPRDAWSCGVLLFCLFLGRCPFWAEDNFSMQVQILYEEMKFPEAAVPPLPRDLLLKLLNKEPDERLSVAAALQHAWFQ